MALKKRSKASKKTKKLHPGKGLKKTQTLSVQLSGSHENPTESIS
jgi:hypothetical protein